MKERKERERERDREKDRQKLATICLRTRPPNMQGNNPVLPLHGRLMFWCFLLQIGACELLGETTANLINEDGNANGNCICVTEGVEKAMLIPFCSNTHAYARQGKACTCGDQFKDLVRHPKP